MSMILTYMELVKAGYICQDRQMAQKHSEVSGFCRGQKGSCCNAAL